jgi:hypothetical protein
MTNERAEAIADWIGMALKRLTCVMAGVVIGIVIGKVLEANHVYAQGKPPQAQAKPNPITGQCAPVEDSRKLAISYLTTVKRGVRIELQLMSGRTVKGWVMNVKGDSGVIVMNVGTPEDPEFAFYKASSLEGCRLSPQ